MARHARSLSIAWPSSTDLSSARMVTTVRGGVSFPEARGGNDRPVEWLAFSADGRTLFSEGREGPLFLWDVATGQAVRTVPATSIRKTLVGKELAALALLRFSYRDEWLIITGQGHYAGSPRAVEAISWRVGSKTYPAEKFEKQYHRPDLVRRALAGEAAE